MMEFLLIVFVYVAPGQGYQSFPLGQHWPDKKMCEEYGAQVKKDLADPPKVIKTTCVPSGAVEREAKAQPKGK